MDVRPVSLGMGKGGFFNGYWKVPPARGPKTGEQGCTAKDQHRLAGESVPAARGRFRLRRRAVFSPASWDTCENVLHVQPSPPAATGMVPVAEGCGDWLGSADGAAGIPVESGAERFSMSASVLLGQDQTKPEQEGFAPRLALGVPWVSCILLPRRGKSLLPQGRGQGSWKRSCGSIHLTLVLQQRCQRCPTARVPAGLSPAWAHPGAVASDGEAVAGTARGRGAISKPHARVFPGAFPQPSASPEAGARGARRRGCKQLRFGAVLSVYSKTSHVLNEEQGDKETPRARRHP